MPPVREIEGVEFDWFALDAQGNPALFATAGLGPVPAPVYAAVPEHDAIGDQLVVTGLGTPDVWNSYSHVGLYVYDWNPAQDAYVRVRVPAVTPSPELAARLRSAPSLPSLPLVFPQASVVPRSVVQNRT